MTHRTLSFYVLLLNISQSFEYRAMFNFALQHSQISTNGLLCAGNTTSSKYWVCPQGNYHFSEESRTNRYWKRWITLMFLSAHWVKSFQNPEVLVLGTRVAQKASRELDLEERVGHEYVEERKGVLHQDLGAKERSLGKLGWRHFLHVFLAPCQPPRWHRGWGAWWALQFCKLVPQWAVWAQSARWFANLRRNYASNMLSPS